MNEQYIHLTQSDHSISRSPSSQNRVLTHIVQAFSCKKTAGKRFKKSEESVYKLFCCSSEKPCLNQKKNENFQSWQLCNCSSIQDRLLLLQMKPNKFFIPDWLGLIVGSRTLTNDFSVMKRHSTISNRKTDNGRYSIGFCQH